jgi:hypothetical protein
MVEIVGRDEKAVKQTTCRECAAILRYTESEVKTRQYSACGELGTIWYVDCPNGHEAIVRQD